MLWILCSLFCFWVVFREFKTRLIAPAGYDRPDPTPIYKPYITFWLILAILFAWPPFKYWRFERFLTPKATELADSRPAKVHCNTIFDTFFDSNYLFAGHANFETGKITFQYPWCKRLMDYLDHPEKANRHELVSLNIFTHESMHIRGEHDEARTECQAVQRNYRVAKLLGVPDSIAKKNALDYYHTSYMQRREAGTFSAGYFSDQCAPGKAMDEHLSDSTWATN